MRKIRIDILAWDTHDQRHAIHGRDDVANLERMYYKDMIHIARRWNNPKWALFPDENSAINWLEIIGYLNNTRLQKPRFMSLFQDGPNQFIEFLEISQRCSTSEPLVQLADLFAGLAAFCRLKGEGYVNWEKQEKNKLQPSLFEFEEAEDESSRADRVRYGIVRFFREKCTHHSLVSWLRNRYTTEF